MKQKINLATSRVRTLVTVSGSFLAIIPGISATYVETSTSTIPHEAVGSSQQNYPPISEFASQSSTGELLPRAKDIALPNEPTCKALPPVKIPLPMVVSGSQGGAD